MFTDATLQSHLTNSSTVKSQSAIIAEWNLNYATNIDEIGNYYYNPNGGSLESTFAKEDALTSQPKYFGGTESNTKLNAGYNSDGTVATAFTKPNQREKSLYSLEDCLFRFRPRSGINKLRYLSTNFTHHTDENLATRPRYYMASKNDKFKYWSSYKKKDGIEYGIAKTPVSGTTAPYYITDAVPFVTYKTSIPANRIVMKMQTNVGTTDLGNIITSTQKTVADPFYGNSNKTTPIKWKVQALQGTTWTDIWTAAWDTPSDVVPTDGYVELSYGITNIPIAYANNFVYAGELTSEALLPPESITGYAYLIRTGTSIGQYRIWNGTSYDAAFTPTYGWYKSTEGLSPTSSVLTELVSPPSYVDGTTKYRDFQYIQGIRIVVATMNKYNSTFDLIEMSPRLVADISDITMEYNVSKTLSDLSTSGIPVGQLLASQGALTIFDSEQAFNSNNQNSIIKDFSSINLQLKFYEIISQVSGVDYFVPIKTMYAEGFPEFNNESRQLSINMRDLFFYFESMTAPQLFIRNASLSYIISTLMDSIGFSNYTFKRNANETKEPIIPEFIVRPDTTVAQVLNDIAISTQCAMFFDEYNNFVVMSKNRMMPTSGEKSTDITLYGSVDSTDNGIVKNLPNATLSNIINVASTTKDIYNDGKITYTNRYIQRSYGSLKQAGQLSQDQTWVYKPSLLWEVSGTENVRPVNNEFANQSSYALSAIPLRTTLPKSLPYVDPSGVIQNNTIDLGEAIYWLPRYKGYFYANGEIIKYDAVEYAVDGQASPVWISDAQEYSDYFSKLKFNGFIYPTGLVRIFTEPYYNSDGSINHDVKYVDADNVSYNGTARGAVAKHGRGQFGTTVAEHNAGLSSYWTNSENTYGCYMESKYLFNTNVSRNYAGTTTTIGSAIVKDVTLNNLDVTGSINLDATLSGKTITGEFTTDASIKARTSSVNGVIKNFLSSDYFSENSISSLNSAVPGTMQSSALVFSGPKFSTINPIDFISYKYKALDSSYNHFGTRMRIVGQLEDTKKESSARTQTAVGSSPIFISAGTEASESKIISGSSGGIGIMVSPTNNTGYFFEIVALTEQSSKTVEGAKNLSNVYFYKTMARKAGNNDSQTIPVDLFHGLMQILVDDGNFTGQSKQKGETTASVYDLSIEYEQIANGLRFYLTINNNLIAVVEDTEPLPITQSVALFVRGSSKCMFENVFAIAQNDPYGSSTGVKPVVDSGPFELDNPEIMYEKYGLNRVIKETILTQINASSTPGYAFYYDEFGTIMRECAYFNIRYDKAYPALLAKISPTFNSYKGYSVSGFTPNAYGAEFMIFNTMDTVINLDETSGNYLRIQGVTFTQESTHDLTLDEYFNKKSDLSNPSYAGKNSSPATQKQTYIDLLNSRSVYGRKEFTITAPYIQDSDTANDLMDWMVTRIMKPRKSIGVDIFAMPIIQLGDIVEINYTDKNNINQVSSSRFIVYSTEYSKNSEGPSMKIYLSEVI